jgi:hypothetical protein
MSSSEKPEDKPKGLRPGMPGAGTPWKPKQSGNPNGKISLKNDLKRAKEIGALPELHRVLNEWRESAGERLAELGAEGFVAALQAAIREACEIDLPPTPEVARAMWWRTTLPVAFAGPCGPKDTVWTYANSEVGNRLLGKQKDHVVLEGSETPPVDWKRVPEEERQALQEAMLRLLGYLGEPASPTEH